MTEENKLKCPVCDHVISDFDEAISDPCSHVAVTYVDILNGEFVHSGDDKVEKELMDKYDEADGDKSLDELMEEYAAANDNYTVIEMTTSGLSCGPCSSTEYNLIKLT